MTEPGGAPRARALAGALRQAREAAKISVREVARRLGIVHSVVSYWETSKRVPRLEDVASYLTAIGVTGDEREAILALARHASDQDWLTVGIPGISQQLAGTMECERAAAAIIDWSPHIVTGLLQTSDYARAIIGSETLPTAEVEARVLVRMGRRDVIMRSNPVRLTAYLGEAALHEMIGGLRVMADQLRHLIKLAESDTITIQIVRSYQGWHPGLHGQFVLYDFDGSPSIVLLEHHRTGAFVADQDDVAAYKTAVDKIHQLAMSPAESLTLITQTAHELEAAR
ncbi:MAG TPA: helix-turn-helix transcriptional regulator [Pseudonocardiaceae bacterium]|nr:helix-turn-helix transcriptional regulator [Pseudonocardiaceae bacterium]